MTSRLYDRMVKLCKSWPLDPSKGERDFGAHLQNQLKAWFPKGQLTLIKNTNELDEQIAALERLNNDVHKRKYDDVRVAKLQPASLMTPEQIKLVLSSDYLKENAEMQRMANRMKSTISEFRYSASKQSDLKEQKGQKGAKK